MDETRAHYHRIARSYSRDSQISRLAALFEVFDLEAVLWRRLRLRTPRVHRPKVSIGARLHESRTRITERHLGAESKNKQKVGACVCVVRGDSSTPGVAGRVANPLSRPFLDARACIFGSCSVFVLVCVCVAPTDLQMAAYTLFFSHAPGALLGS